MAEGWQAKIEDNCQVIKTDYFREEQIKYFVIEYFICINGSKTDWTTFFLKYFCLIALDLVVSGSSVGLQSCYVSIALLIRFN